MLYLRSMVNVADNSGAKVAMVIQNLKGPRVAARVGDRVVVVCKQVRKNLTTTGKVRVMKSDVRHAIVTRTRKEQRGHDGRYISFGENAVIMVDNKGEPLGTRLSRQGIVSELLHRKNQLKLQALAPLI